MYSNKSVDVHKFTMIPKADIPRSRFRIEKTLKTAFNAGYLIPIYVNEILPGDTFNLRLTMFGRLATPIVPIMDNLHLDTFFFFVPARLVWVNWEKFMGAQDNPDDSTSFLIPTVQSDAGGYPVNSIYDYMGLPTFGQLLPGGQVTNNALPLRAYNLIWNEWFRDENLQDSVLATTDDGPDSNLDYVLLRRGKRKDYFTGALPWPQKGDPVTMPLGDKAPVIGIGKRTLDWPQAGQQFWETGGNLVTYPFSADISPSIADQVFGVRSGAGATGASPAIYADLSEATAATINSLRTAFQIQKLLERDARGGTRYTELVLAHFGVHSPDARLQRPEYLGGGSQRININPVAQTSATDSGGGETPQGNLAAMGTVMASGHGFTQSFTEHGYVIGLCSVRADLTYQQGIHKMWTRSTKYDFYFPAFAMLGEQAVLNKEIYYTGSAGTDDAVFGYQERWAEYRYDPSQITGLMRSTSLNTIDVWHLSQRFTGTPTLNNTFIQDNPPLERILAVGAEANGQQLILDAFFSLNAARPLPMYSQPGLIDHF